MRTWPVLFSFGICLSISVVAGCSDEDQSEQQNATNESDSGARLNATDETLLEVAIRGPVTVRIAVDDEKSTETEIELTIAVECEFGWHTYAQVSGEIAVQRTDVELLLPAELVVVDSVKRPRGKPNREQPGTLIYEGLTTFRCRIERPTTQTMVACNVSFQACDETTCRLPETVNLGINVGG